MDPHHLAVSKIFIKNSLSAYCVSSPRHRTVDKTDRFPALVEFEQLVEDSHKGRCKEFTVLEA